MILKQLLIDLFDNTFQIQILLRENGQVMVEPPPLVEHRHGGNVQLDNLNIIST